MENKKLDVNKYGGFLITKSVLEKEDIGAFWFREESPIQELNGWNIFGLNDSKEYLEQAENWTVATIDNIFELMPHVVTIFNAPYDSEFEIEYDEEAIVTRIFYVNLEKYIFDINNTK